MKRILTGLALTTAVALVTGTPAQAAVDPVKALKKQFVPGHGVRIVETSRTTVDGKGLSSAKTAATFVFGRSGVAASDVRNGAADNGIVPPRAITVGGHTYAQGGPYSQSLPEGKKWVRYPGLPTGSTYSQALDVFDPNVLKALVTKAKSHKGNTYKGWLTQDELSTATHTKKLGGKLGKMKIDYVLSVNSKGLASTLKSGWSMDFGILGSYRQTTTTRYIGWGSKVTIKAPAKDQWVDVSDLSEDSEAPEALKESTVDTLITQ